jgi:hypothetical protein
VSNYVPMISRAFADNPTNVLPVQGCVPVGGGGRRFPCSILFCVLNTDSHHLCSPLVLLASVGIDAPADFWLGRNFRYLVLISDYDGN